MESPAFAQSILRTPNLCVKRFPLAARFTLIANDTEAATNGMARIVRPELSPGHTTNGRRAVEVLPDPLATQSLDLNNTPDQCECQYNWRAHNDHGFRHRQFADGVQYVSAEDDDADRGHHKEELGQTHHPERLEFQMRRHTRPPQGRLKLDGPNRNAEVKLSSRNYFLHVE
jgi:hypothetical protein